MEYVPEGNEKIRILYSDKRLAVCVKPVGILSEDAERPEDGMPGLLSQLLGGRFLCVHRLDRGVGGVMVYARDGKTAAALSEQFSEKSGEGGGGAARKEYLAVVSGRPEEDAGTLSDLLFHDKRNNKTFITDRERAGVRRAELRYSLCGTAQTDGGTLSLLSVVLITGRSHQIRAQFAGRKMPLVGDGKYGSRVKCGEIALFARSLAFLHPGTGEKMRFEADAPDGFPWALFGENVQENT